jgi:hypothetical protein
MNLTGNDFPPLEPNKKHKNGTPPDINTLTATDTMESHTMIDRDEINLKHNELKAAISVELTTLHKETANMQKALQDQFSIAMETLKICIIKGTQTMVTELSKMLEKAVENMNAQAAQSADFL